jgi:hypothetical protein
MPKFKVTYTEDFGDSYHTLPEIEAETLSKAYIEAYVQIPLRAAIINIWEVEDDGSTVL